MFLKVGSIFPTFILYKKLWSTLPTLVNIAKTWTTVPIFIFYLPHIYYRAKKDREDDEKNTDSEPVNEDIMIGALSRGLTLSDLDNLRVGQIVDYAITYNKQNKPKDENLEDKETVKNATQEDIDRF